jgi:hypothetical protein
MKICGLILSLFFVASGVRAMEHDKVTMDDEIQVDGKKLHLNGMGTRIVYKFGIPVKVYVAGLYLEQKTDDSKKIIEGPQLRRLVLNFRRSVTRDQASDGWREGFYNNCFIDCDKSKAQFSKEFLPYLTSLSQGQIQTLTFYPDRVEYILDKEKPRILKGADFAKNLMAEFFGKKMPNRELVEGMLGKK